jgi:hypothetical protein
LEKFGWENLDLSLYSPEFLPTSGFCQKWRVLFGKPVATDGVARESVKNWLTVLAEDFNDEGIVKFPQHLHNYLTRNEDYVEK